MNIFDYNRFLGPARYDIAGVKTWINIKGYGGIIEYSLDDDNSTNFELNQSIFSIFVCGGYKNIIEGWTSCFRLNLETPEEGWVEVGSMVHGRYNLGLVGLGEYLYAIGGTNGVEQWRSIEVIMIFYVEELTSVEFLKDLSTCIIDQSIDFVTSDIRHEFK